MNSVSATNENNRFYINHELSDINEDKQNQSEEAVDDHQDSYHHDQEHEINNNNNSNNIVIPQWNIKDNVNINNESHSEGNNSIVDENNINKNVVINNEQEEEENNNNNNKNEKNNEIKSKEEFREMTLKCEKDYNMMTRICKSRVDACNESLEKVIKFKELLLNYIENEEKRRNTLHQDLANFTSRLGYN
jgi:hypothetical protein